MGGLPGSVIGSRPMTILEACFFSCQSRAWGFVMDRIEVDRCRGRWDNPPRTFRHGARDGTENQEVVF